MTTLEKIRAEIADNHDFYFFAESNRDIALGLEYALEIIDKYAEQEPCEEWQNGYDMGWEEAKVFYEKEEPTSPCDLCKFNCKDICCLNCPAIPKGGE